MGGASYRVGDSVGRSLNLGRGGGRFRDDVGGARRPEGVGDMSATAGDLSGYSYAGGAAGTGMGVSRSHPSPTPPPLSVPPSLGGLGGLGGLGRGGRWAVDGGGGTSADLEEGRGGQLREAVIKGWGMGGYEAGGRARAPSETGGESIGEGGRGLYSYEYV